MSFPLIGLINTVIDILYIGLVLWVALNFLKFTKQVFLPTQNNSRGIALIYSVGTLIVVTVLTWPFIGKKYFAEVSCDLAQRNAKFESIDLRKSGYHFVRKAPQYNDIFEQAIRDLVAKRISFFEVETEPLTGIQETSIHQHLRYTLQVKNSIRCSKLEGRRLEILFETTAPEQCLAEEKINSLSTTPLLKIKNPPGSYTFELIDAMGNKISSVFQYVFYYSEFKWAPSLFGLFRMPIKSLYCSSLEKKFSNYTPSLTPFILLNSNGKVLPVEKAIEQGNLSFEEKLLLQKDISVDFNTRDLAGLESSCELEKFNNVRKIKVTESRNNAPLIESNTTIDPSGNPAAVITLQIDAPGQPVLLDLYRYNSTIWKIYWSPKTEIVGAIVNGYHAPAILGLSKNTPINIDSYYSKRNSSCKSNQLRFVNTTNELRYEVSQQSNVIRLTQREALPDDWLTTNDYQLSDFELRGEVLPGDAGVEQLTKSRKLVHAGKKEVDLIDNKHKEYVNKRGLEHLFLDNTFLVTGSTEIPRGLAGADSKIFLVPKDIPFPTGDFGHSTIVRLRLDCSEIEKCKQARL